MAIAKVEPLTTARALRGPFDYRLPRGDGRRRASGPCCAFRSGRGGSSAWSSSSPSAASCLRSGSPSRSRRSRRARRRSSCGLACGWRASTARPRLAGSASCFRPARRGPAGRSVRQRTGTSSSQPRDGRRCFDGERLGAKQRAALQSLAESDGPMRAHLLEAAPAPPARPSGGSPGAGSSSFAAWSAAGGRSRPRSGPRTSACQLNDAQGAAAARRGRRHGPRRRPGAPAPRRDRIRQDRGLSGRRRGRRWSAVSERSCWCRRSP